MCLKTIQTSTYTSIKLVFKTSKCLIVDKWKLAWISNNLQQMIFLDFRNINP